MLQEADLCSCSRAGEMYVSWVTGDYVFSVTPPSGPPPITVASKVLPLFIIVKKPSPGTTGIQAELTGRGPREHVLLCQERVADCIAATLTVEKKC